MMEQVFYAKAFENGNRARTMAQLRVPSSRIHSHESTASIMGFFVGTGICLCVYSIVAFATTPHSDTPMSSDLPPPLNSYPAFVPVFLVFRGLVCCYRPLRNA
jgi:hypothetical protein